jgi:hypothetical protein
VDLLVLTSFHRQFSQASFAASFGLVDGGSAIASPGFVFSITYQLSHYLSSSLQWKTGGDSFMKGGLHYDNQKLAVSTAVQVGRFTVSIDTSNASLCSWASSIRTVRSMVSIGFRTSAIYIAV